MKHESYELKKLKKDNASLSKKISQKDNEIFLLNDKYKKDKEKDEGLISFLKSIIIFLVMGTTLLIVRNFYKGIL